MTAYRFLHCYPFASPYRNLNKYQIFVKYVYLNWMINAKHTHNRFTALLDFVRDYPGEPAPER